MSAEQQRQLSDDVRSRLSELSALNPGWFDQENPAPFPSSIERMRRFFLDVVASWGLPDPSVYPCPDGEISSQWSGGPWEFDAVTVSGGHRIDLHAVHVETMAQVESRLGAGDAEQDIATFLAFIGSLRLPA